MRRAECATRRLFTVKVHLYDGTYELFRAFFGAPKATSVTGQEVGATRGLMRSLLGPLLRGETTHVAIAFDHVIESFRNELFVGYKTSAGVPPELLAQFELAERATSALGIVTWPMVEFEADDALSTAAARFAADPRVEQVVICSPDKDLAQCVRGTRVVLFDRLRKKVLDEASVKAKFGVAPAAIPEWLALVGDAADGYPGIPKWGAKSSAAVLGRFGRLEAVPSDPTAWGLGKKSAMALAESLVQHRDELVLYRTLATLRLDVPLCESLDDLEWKGAHRAALSELCNELGDTETFARITRFSD